MATNPDPKGGKFLGPYIDPSITVAPPIAGPQGNTQPMPVPNLGKTIPTPVPARSGSTTLGRVTIYDPVTPQGVDLVDFEPGDQGAQPPPYSPNSWEIEDQTINEGVDGAQSTQSRSRDYYRNGGMIGQGFLNNQG